MGPRPAPASPLGAVFSEPPGSPSAASSALRAEPSGTAPLTSAAHCKAKEAAMACRSPITPGSVETSSDRTGATGGPHPAPGAGASPADASTCRCARPRTLAKLASAAAPSGEADPGPGTLPGSMGCGPIPAGGAITLSESRSMAGEIPSSRCDPRPPRNGFCGSWTVSSARTVTGEFLPLPSSNQAIGRADRRTPAAGGTSFALRGYVHPHPVVPPTVPEPL